ncbi:MAG: TetR family transcriptional regulator [Acetobacteraceae bacterium]
MARPIAADHDAKRRLILERSAELFAAHGYDRASLSMLARACGMSKALFYHYYSEKSEVLFDIIRTHLDDLLAVTANLDETERDENPRRRLLLLAEALLDAYRAADAKHHVQISQLHLLPEAEQELIRNMQRRLVDRFAAAIAPCLPPRARGQALLKPITMSLFAMLNWNHLWFRERGPLSRSDYAGLAVTLLIDGAGSIPADPVFEGRAVLHAVSFDAVP